MQRVGHAGPALKPRDARSIAPTCDSPRCVVDVVPATATSHLQEGWYRGRRLSLRRSASFIALSFGVALSACQALVGLATREEAPAPDGSTPPPPPDVDAGADVTSAPRPECAQDLPPPSVVPSVNDIPPFAMALATGGYTSPDAGVLCPVPGFDFDGKRTCLDDGGRSSHNLAVCDGGADASCQSSCENRRALDTETASTLCDLANGVDNAFQGITIALRSSISKVQVDRIVDLTALFQSGAATLVFNVSGYSGEPDDDHVAVSVFNGTGLAGGATSWDGQSQITWDVTSYGFASTGTFATAFSSCLRFAGCICRSLLRPAYACRSCP